MAGSVVPTYMTGAFESATHGGPADTGRQYALNPRQTQATRGNGGFEYNPAVMTSSARAHVERVYPARMGVEMSHPYAHAGSSGQDSGITETMHSAYLKCDHHP